LIASTLRPDRHIVVTMQDGAVRNLLDECAPPVDIVETTRQAGALPLARARNLGAQQAMNAGADLLIYLDVDCVPSPMLVSRYAQHAAQEMRPSLLCGPVSYLPPPPHSGYRLSSLPGLGRPHPARPVPPETGALAGGDHALFWSLSFAVRAALWRELGGFCEQYIGYGAEDTDFGQVAAGRAIALTWVGGVGLPSVPSRSRSARAASDGHRAQRGHLPPPVGMVADDRLAARVRATRAHRVRGPHPDLADRLTAPGSARPAEAVDADQQA
jgi:hypothetical protein